MKRKVLSSGLIAEKAVILISIVFFIVAIANSVSAVRQDFLWIVPVYIGIFYIVFYLPDRIEFDNENMYLTRRSAHYTIPLKDIYIIKMTPIGIGHKFMRKIKFNVNGVKGDARFYNRWYFSSTYGSFCDHVKLMNPKLEIENFTWSFDFDM